MPVANWSGLEWFSKACSDRFAATEIYLKWLKILKYGGWVECKYWLKFHFAWPPFCECSPFSCLYRLVTSISVKWSIKRCYQICFACLYVFTKICGKNNNLCQYGLLCLSQRLPFTLGFVGSMVGTIYVSMVLHSYILSVLFSMLQVTILVILTLVAFSSAFISLSCS